MYRSPRLFWLETVMATDEEEEEEGKENVVVVVVVVVVDELAFTIKQ